MKPTLHAYAFHNNDVDDNNKAPPSETTTKPTLQVYTFPPLHLIFVFCAMAHYSIPPFSLSAIDDKNDDVDDADEA